MVLMGGGFALLAATRDFDVLEPMLNDLHARRFRYNERFVPELLRELEANIAGFCVGRSGPGGQRLDLDDEALLDQSGHEQQGVGRVLALGVDLGEHLDAGGHEVGDRVTSDDIGGELEDVAET
jgi:hypothetical protein